MALPGIVIQIGADTKDAIDGINRVNSELGNGLSGADKFKASVDKAFVPALAALGGLAAAAIDFGKAAAEDEKAAGILANTLQNTTGATDAQVASTEAWIAQQGTLLGVTDDQLRPALGALATATGDLATAQSLASTAMDIAAAKGIPLEQASQAMAKAAVGQTAALKKLIPGLSDAALKSGDLATIQAEVASKVGGSAATAANSAAGQWGRFQLTLDETKESIGAALLPAFQAIMPYLQMAGAWAREHSGLFVAVGIAIGTVAAAIVILKIAMTAWTVVQWALNSALLASPITWIILGIIALVAIVVIMYNKFDWFKNFIDSAWAGIQTAIGVVVDWFQAYVWPVIKFVIDLIVAYFKLYWTIVSFVWNLVLEAIKLVVDWFQTYVAPIIKVVIDLIVGYFQAYWTVIQTVWNGIQTAIQAVVSWFQTTVAPAIQLVIGFVQSYFQNLWNGLQIIWNGIKTAIQAVLSWFIDTYVGAFKVALEALQTVFSTVIDFIKGLWNGLIDFLTGLVDKFLEIGKGIVEGIKRGIQNAWAAFTEWLTGLMNNLIKSVLGIFGIKSPSKVFRAIGEDIVAGWKLGLSGIEDVNAAILASASSVTTGLSTSLTVPVATTTTAATTSSSSTVVVTEEQIARAIASILLRSDQRNGRTVVVA
jgi:hypothetical protein